MPLAIRDASATSRKYSLGARGGAIFFHLAPEMTEESVLRKFACVLFIMFAIAKRYDSESKDTTRNDINH